MIILWTFFGSKLEYRFSLLTFSDWKSEFRYHPVEKLVFQIIHKFTSIMFTLCYPNFGSNQIESKRTWYIGLCLLVIGVSSACPRGSSNPLRSMQKRRYGPWVGLLLYIGAVCRKLPLHEIYTQCRQYCSSKLPTSFIYPTLRLFLS